MQAYNKSDLYNKYVSDQASEGLQTGCISSESYHNILQAYPCRLYTPNYFIRIALGLLTTISVLFLGLLTGLIFSASDANGIVGVMIFIAIISYSALELLVKHKHYFNAGVDNILMIIVTALAAGVFLVHGNNPSWQFICGVAMVISLWLSIRFVDAFLAMVCYGCFFVCIFLSYLQFGHMAKATAPLVMMAISALVYTLIKKWAGGTNYMYQRCFKAVIFLTLVTFYISGNYFIVKELSNQIFHLQLTLNDPLPLGWLFWIFTLMIPLAYIIYGIRKKDLLMMRTGLGLMAASVATVQYYFNLVPSEIEMLILGTILISVSYALIKYLEIPKYGFTSNILNFSKKETENVESLITAETFDRQTAKENPTLYGDGSGGGGGASGEY